MVVTVVGLREFRADLAHYVDAGATVAVQHHGRTVGYFIPVRADLTAERNAFEAATARLDALLTNEDVEDVLRDVDRERR